jgi:hypothetical protein
MKNVKHTCVNCGGLNSINHPCKCRCGVIGLHYCNVQQAVNFESNKKPGETMSGQNLEAFEAEAREIVESAITLLVNKRKDYGDNSLRGGIQGITIRMSDKLGRLENLLGISDGSFQRKQTVISDESLKDTLKDILNYSLLGLMELQKNDGKKAKNG